MELLENQLARNLKTQNEFRMYSYILLSVNTFFKKKKMRIFYNHTIYSTRTNVISNNCESQFLEIARALLNMNQVKARRWTHFSSCFNNHIHLDNKIALVVSECNDVIEATSKRGASEGWKEKVQETALFQQAIVIETWNYEQAEYCGWQYCLRLEDYSLWEIRKSVVIFSEFDG